MRMQQSNPYYLGNWVIASNLGWHSRIFQISEAIALEKFYEAALNSRADNECLQLWSESYNQWDLKRLVYVSNYENN